MATGQGIWNQDWLNENSQRKYPLSQTALVTDTSGSFVIPDDFIVDMVFPVHADPTIDPTLFHVAGIGIFGQGVTIAIGYNGDVIANVSIDQATFKANSVYAVQGTGAFFDTVGRIVIGFLDTILESAGSFLFDVANGRFEPAVIRPDIRGVSAIYIQNGTDVSAPIQNDVVLQAGRNFQLTLVNGVGSEPNRITMNAIDGAGLNQDCGCSENNTLPCIQTINGIPGDNANNFTILDDPCIVLNDIANGLQIVDNCSKPCCGCNELDVVTAAAQTLAAQIFALENFASQLQASIDTLSTNLVSSKTGTLK